MTTNDPAADPIGTVRRFPDDGSVWALTGILTEISSEPWAGINGERATREGWLNHDELGESAVIGAVPGTPAAEQVPSVQQLLDLVQLRCELTVATRENKRLREALATGQAPAADEHQLVHLVMPSDWREQVRDVADVAGQIRVLETWITPDAVTYVATVAPTLVAVIEHELTLAQNGDGYEPAGVAREIVAKHVAPLLAAKDAEIESCRRTMRSVEAQNYADVRLKHESRRERDDANQQLPRLRAEIATLRADLAEARKDAARKHAEVQGYYAEFSRLRKLVEAIDPADVPRTRDALRRIHAALTGEEQA